MMEPLWNLFVMVVVATVTTLLGSRLLGVRRGWLRQTIAGALGWVIALVIAVGLANWDWSRDGLLASTVVLAVPATMALMLLFDLVARPGSLAQGDRAGFVEVPRPIADLRGRVAPIARYRELLAILRRHQLLGRLNGRVDPEEVGRPAEVRVREALEEAGGVYVKLGQIAATRIDLLPAGLCEELGRLQSRSAPVPASEVRTVLEQQYGKRVEEVFARFDWSPLAAASIGQTHTAALTGGEEVVVKVQRPGIETTIERDLAALDQLARLAERRTAAGRDLRVSRLATEFGRSLRSELDFRDEATATAAMHELLGEGPITVPAVHRELSTRRVMVQERLVGVPLSELAPDADIDREALARQLLTVTVEQLFQVGIFHADPHPGNVMVLEDGSLGLIDFGAVGRLDSIQIQAVIDMLIALTRGDAALLRDGVERVADVGAHVSRDRLERALARLLAEHVGPSGTVDVHALADLIPVLGEFEISLPGDLVVLMRALVTLDGTLGVLSPGFSVVSVGRELAQRESEDRAAGDPQEILMAALISDLPVLRRLPADLGRTLALASRGSLQVRTVASEDESRFTRTMWNRTLLAGIGVGLGLVSVLLMGLEIGPRVGGGARLVTLLGVGGLGLGAILLMRVVAAVVRDGTV
ncbi:MAG: AarF/ABC1/UbiB kinase family protein [Actinobacteria bacterium]|nr:AarF/ABC1/UbiB kinase family protein [Actinomycetota bacterium]